MSLIAFSNERVWPKAGWIVSRFIADMVTLAPDDPEVKEALTGAVELRSLCVDLYAPSVAKQLTDLISRTANATLDEKETMKLTWHHGLDEKRRLYYTSAIRELIEILPER